MCIFASALYIKLGKQLILLYFKTMQNSDFKGGLDRLLIEWKRNSSFHPVLLVFLFKRLKSIKEKQLFLLNSLTENLLDFMTEGLGQHLMVCFIHMNSIKVTGLGIF